MEEETISLQDFMDALLRKWWVLLLGSGLAAVAALGLGMLRPASPEPPPLTHYGAATVVVMEGAENLAQFPELVETRAVLEDAIADLGLGRSVAEVRDVVTASPVGGTSLLRITAQDPDAATAEALADGVARSLVEHISAAQPARPVLAPETLDDRAPVVLSPYIIAPAELLEAPPTQAAAAGSDNPIVRNLILGLLLGGILSAGVVVGLEYIQSPLRSPVQLERRCRLAPLGMLPRWAKSGEQPGSLLAAQAAGPEAQSLREAAAGVVFAAGVRCARVLAVVSPAAGDGRTSLTANLGVALASGWRRVILVDGDLRRPGLHHYFGLTNRYGLRDYLSNAALAASDVIQATPYPRLKVITAGMPWPNAGSLLDSPRMKELWEHLLDEADLVLVDTPPAGETIDGMVLAAQVQGVVLVVNGETTRQDAVEGMLSKLGMTGTPVLGYVWNRLSTRKFAGRFGSPPALTDLRRDASWDRPVAAGREAEVPGARSTAGVADPEPAVKVRAGL